VNTHTFVPRAAGNLFHILLELYEFYECVKVPRLLGYGPFQSLIIFESRRIVMFIFARPNWELFYSATGVERAHATRKYDS
jgi:hypothetical protein